MATVADSVTLSQAALDERRQAVECVLGSLRIEGLEVSPLLASLLCRFELGEISLEELNRMHDEQSVSLR